MFLYTLNQLFLLDVSIINGSTYAIVFSKSDMTEWSTVIHRLPKRKNVVVYRRYAFRGFPYNDRQRDNGAETERNIITNYFVKALL